MAHKLSVSLILYATFVLRSAANSFDKVDPDLSQGIGLICYQCNSMNTDTTPLCDNTMFPFSKKEEKKNMSFHCPHYQGKYCFKKTNKLGLKQIETVRGCSGSTDKKNNELKVGCVTTKKMTYCLCDTNLCNKTGHHQNVYRICLFTIIIFILLSNNIFFL